MESATKNTILRTLIGTTLFLLISGFVVSIIGLMLGWKTSTQFSDGFFWAGVIMMSIGIQPARHWLATDPFGPG